MSTTLLLLLLISLTWAAFFPVLRAAWGPLRPVSIAILLLAAAPRLAYVYETHAYTRSYDSPGHASYLTQIAGGKRLPRAKDCWQCYQPPGYYLLAAPFVRLGSLVKHRRARAMGKATQCFSLMLYMLFLLASARLIESLLVKDVEIALALAPLAFLPASIAHSARVGAEPLIYFVVALGLLLCARWERAPEDRRARLGAAALAGFGLVVKATAAILCLLVLMLTLRDLVRRRDRASWRESALVVLVLGLGVACYAGHLVHNRTRLSAGNWLVGNLEGGLPPQQVVGNSWRNFLVFDVATFLRAPEAGMADDSKGRQYFANYALRTAISGEWDTVGVVQPWLGRLLGALVLAGLAIALLGAWHAPPSWPRWTVFGAIVLSILALAWQRYRVPLNSSNDFRYVYFALGPLGICFAAGAVRLPVGLQFVLRAAVLLFALAGVLFTACYLDPSWPLLLLTAISGSLVAVWYRASRSCREWPASPA